MQQFVTKFTPNLTFGAELKLFASVIIAAAALMQIFQSNNLVNKELIKKYGDVTRFIADRHCLA
jgi:hypothetical protein